MDHYRVIASPITLREQERSLPSSAWLMPSDKFWDANETLVVTDKRNYTVNDYNAFFKDINYTDGWNMYLDTKDLIHDLTPPGVEVSFSVHHLCVEISLFSDSLPLRHWLANPGSIYLFERIVS